MTKDLDYSSMAPLSSTIVFACQNKIFIQINAQAISASTICKGALKPKDAIHAAITNITEKQANRFNKVFLFIRKILT